MDIKIIARAIAYLALAGALLAAAIALSNRQYPTAGDSRTEPSPATAALDAELAHCQAIGAEAADDGACKADLGGQSQALLRIREALPRPSN